MHFRLFRLMFNVYATFYIEWESWKIMGYFRTYNAIEINFFAIISIQKQERRDRIHFLKSKFLCLSSLLQFAFHILRKHILGRGWEWETTFSRTK